ncbi:hypothetical protein EDB84DRAFT_1435152 [Lactarius hengduanensis]|nr:hypothetical protein EDB84DRAFT_1435152 [Lactarius hengduanensis]
MAPTREERIIDPRKEDNLDLTSFRCSTCSHVDLRVGFEAQPPAWRHMCGFPLMGGRKLQRGHRDKELNSTNPWARNERVQWRTSRTWVVRGVQHIWVPTADLARQTWVPLGAILLERYVLSKLCPDNQGHKCRPSEAYLRTLAANTVRSQFRSGGSVTISDLWKTFDQANTLSVSAPTWNSVYYFLRASNSRVYMICHWESPVTKIKSPISRHSALCRACSSSIALLFDSVAQDRAQSNRA